MYELLRGIVSILRTGVEGLELGVRGLACMYACTRTDPRMEKDGTGMCLGVCQTQGVAPLTTVLLSLEARFPSSTLLPFLFGGLLIKAEY